MISSKIFDFCLIYMRAKAQASLCFGIDSTEPPLLQNTKFSDFSLV